MNGIEYIENYLDYLYNTDGRDKKTIIAYRRNLYEWNNYMFNSNFTLDDLENLTFIDMRQKWLRPRELDGLKPQSLNQRIVAVKAFLNYMQGLRLITRNAADQLKKYTPKKTEKKILNKDELIKLINYTKNEYDKNKDYYSCRDNLILNIFISTGMRLHEVSGLNIDDINWSTGEFSFIGKRSYEREIVLNDYALNVFREYLNHRNIINVDHNALFISKKKNRLSDKQIERTIDKLTEAANVNRITPHSLRHSFCTFMVNNGNIPEEVAKIAGHKNIQTFYSWYLHQEKDNVKEIINNNPIYNLM